MDITTERYRERMANVQSLMQKERFDAWLFYSDCWRTQNVRYLMDYATVDGIAESMCLLLVPAEGKPTVFVADLAVASAKDKSWWSGDPVRTREMKKFLVDFQRKSKCRRLGIAGFKILPAPMYEQIREAFKDCEIELVDELYGRLKAIKDEIEIRLFRQAAAIVDQGMEAMRKALTEGNPKTELELSCIYEQTVSSLGGQFAFYPIILSGPHSAWNCGRPTDRTIREGDSVLADVGARYRDYVADTCRGITVGKVSNLQKKYIEATAVALEEALGFIGAGVTTCSELNKFIQKLLAEQGFSKIAKEATQDGTGHGTGTDPSDLVPWILEGNQTVLEKNMVFCLKTAAFDPGKGGARCEDVVLVTETGAEPLNKFPYRNYW